MADRRVEQAKAASRREREAEVWADREATGKQARQSGAPAQAQTAKGGDGREDPPRSRAGRSQGTGA